MEELEYTQQPEGKLVGCIQYWETAMTKKTFFYVCKIVISSRLFSSEGSPEKRDPGLASFPSLATVAH